MTEGIDLAMAMAMHPFCVGRASSSEAKTVDDDVPRGSVVQYTADSSAGSHQFPPHQI